MVVSPIACLTVRVAGLAASLFFASGALAADELVELDGLPNALTTSDNTRNKVNATHFFELNNRNSPFVTHDVVMIIIINQKNADVSLIFNEAVVYEDHKVTGVTCGIVVTLI